MKINKKSFRTIYYQCLEDILAIRPINEELRNRRLIVLGGDIVLEELKQKILKNEK